MRCAPGFRQANRRLPWPSMPAERESPTFAMRIPDPAGSVPSSRRAPTREQRAERARRVGLSTTNGWGVFFGILMAAPYSLFLVLIVMAHPWLTAALVLALVWVVFRVLRRRRRRSPRREPAAPPSVSEHE